MAPLAAHLHKLGFRLLRYLDDWLILAQSHEEAIQACDTTLKLCANLGVVVNLEKSDLQPSQEVTPGDENQLCDFLGFPDTEMHRYSSTNNRRILVLRQPTSHSMEITAGPYKLIHNPGPRFTIEDQEPTDSAEETMEPQENLSHSSLGRGLQERPIMGER